MPDNLETAAYWASVSETVADVAFAIVIIALAVELIAGRVARRFTHQIDTAREMRLAELQRIAPRILSVPDQNTLRDKLEPFGPLVAMIGTTTPLRHALDIDSLASQIAGVLALAGWKADGSTTWGSDDRPSGVWVSVREGEEDAGKAADTLVSELNRAGIAAHRDSKPFAGPKPSQPPAPPPLPTGLSADDPASIAARARTRTMSDALQRWKGLPDIQVVVGTKE